MVSATKALRIAVDKNALLGFTDFNATAAWTVGVPVSLQFHILAQFFIVKLGENISMVWAVEVATYNRDRHTVRI